MTTLFQGLYAGTSAAQQNIGKHTNFKFNPNLDVKYLRSFYQGDLALAQAMFAIFFDITIKDYYAMLQQAKNKNWKEVRHLAHKMRPNFNMVGLTNLSKMLEMLEDDTLPVKLLVSFLKKFNIVLKKYLPIIKKEEKRIGNAIGG